MCVPKGGKFVPPAIEMDSGRRGSGENMATTCMQPVSRVRGGMLIASPDAEFRRRCLGGAASGERLHHEVEGGAHALAKLDEFEWERVVLDSRLPDLDAAEVAEMIRERCPRAAVEVVDTEREAAKVEEEKEPERNCFDPAGAEVTESKDTADIEINEGQERLARVESLPGMVGSSAAMEEMYQLARLVAPRDTTVLLTGETGTGKELVANAIHQLSRRAKQPFVTVNCAAIPEALLESELFGHVRGAFTGAVQSRLGRVHVAHGGTLFLDEVGELPLGMQSKLLRFLQNGEVQRLGSADVYRMDVRVICATNARLGEMVQAKQFRQDLYYRLAVFPVHLPPLRQRLEDLEALAEFFLGKLAEDAEMPVKRLSREAKKTLASRRWEGNVRELQHALERAFILAGSGEELLPEHCRELSERDDFEEVEVRE